MSEPALGLGALVGGRYRLRRVLGRGAMGAVYEAEREGSGRRVALKTLLPRYGANERAFARLAREARIAAAVGHENIVEALDFGVDGGAPYLVMELLEGETVAEALAREQVFSPQRACFLAGEILAALAAAHEAGVLHRDLKPGNVFLARDEATEAPRCERVKVLDFGVSKLVDDASFDPARTDEGATIGTPSYMAPEQWLGQVDIDARADLFSLGVMLFEMLTGGLPYEGATRDELFREVVRGHDEPEAPSTLAEGIPPGLDAVLRKALRRARDERYASAEAFLEALRPYGATARIRTKPSSPRRPRSLDETEGDGPAPRPHATGRAGRALAAASALALTASLAASTPWLLARARTRSAPSSGTTASAAPLSSHARATEHATAVDLRATPSPARTAPRVTSLAERTGPASPPPPSETRATRERPLLDARDARSTGALPRAPAVSFEARDRRTAAPSPLEPTRPARWSGALEPVREF